MDNEPDLFTPGIVGDPTRKFHGGNPESVAAHDSLGADSKSKLKLWFLQLIDKAGTRGLTCDEIEALTGVSHQTASARITELKAELWIAPNGKRPTRSGRKAAVYFHIASR